jgi:predicted acetyltransferase
LVTRVSTDSGQHWSDSIAGGVRGTPTMLNALDADLETAVVDHAPANNVVARRSRLGHSVGVITLPEPPHLASPTTAVRMSFLTGELADCVVRETATDWLGPASEDFDAFVAARRGVVTHYGVPSTVFWYVSGEHYLAALVIRHQLTPELERVGGHIGYHVVSPWRRQGHATRMLAAGLGEARKLGLDRVLLTCASDNEWSRRVIIANGGIPDGFADGEDRFWITVP